MARWRASALIAEGLDGGDRAEDLFAQAVRAFGHGSEDGRRIEEAPGACGGPRASGQLSAKAELGPFGEGILHEGMNPRPSLGRNKRADIVALIQPVAKSKSGHARGESLQEGLGNAGMDEDAVGRRAGLADAAHLRRHAAFHGGGEVGIGQDDEGGVAAELHRRLENALGGAGKQEPPDFGGAGEGEGAHALVSQHELGEGPGALGGEGLDEAAVHARLLQEGSEGKGGERSLAGGLEEAGAASGKRGGDFARRHGEGEVPRRDEEGEADRGFQRTRLCAPLAGASESSPPPRTASSEYQRKNSAA